jgi:hypothetical protein
LLILLAPRRREPADGDPKKEGCALRNSTLRDLLRAIHPAVYFELALCHIHDLTACLLYLALAVIASAETDGDGGEGS